jgi:hypothetical protein
VSIGAVRRAADRVSARRGRRAQRRVAFSDVALKAAHRRAELRAVLAQRDRCDAQ